MEFQCPWCGPREQSEFICGGEAHIRRPLAPETESDRAWAEYLFVRPSPRGVHHERWQHVYGCGHWFHIARDTVTHRISRVYRMDEAPAGDPT